ncbi:CDP-abequose synthase [Bacteroidia bacterium]|nr:CDP-abequose synthase [Bacteroidia bacterium]
MKILLTGATGFLGSHVAELLCGEEYELLLVKRTCSKLDKCYAFGDNANVQWINSDQQNWLNISIIFNPDVIIHCAWSGVNSYYRENLDVQLSNMKLFSQLLYIAEKVSVNKFISLGSQAEYGQFEECIDENYPVNPTTKYGIIKLTLLYMLKSFSLLHNIDWYWLRVFSIFGEREDDSWILTSAIKRMLSGYMEMNFTKGEQVYSYLYVKDFANAINLILKKKGESGIYNLSSSKHRKLKDILNHIKMQINSECKLNFGILPYRPNQSMYMGGDSSLFIKKFGDFETLNFEQHLYQLIEYYKKRRNEVV